MLKYYTTRKTLLNAVLNKRKGNNSGSVNVQAEEIAKDTSLLGIFDGKLILLYCFTSETFSNSFLKIFDISKLFSLTTQNSIHRFFFNWDFLFLLDLASTNYSRSLQVLKL